MTFRHAIALTVILSLGIAPASLAQTRPSGRVTEVPDAVKQAIMDHMQKTFLYPQLTIWKFDYMQPYPTEGVAVCGRVNYLNSTRHYVGERGFYAHVNGGEVLEAGILSTSVREDPVLAIGSAYKIACG